MGKRKKYQKNRERKEEVSESKPLNKSVIGVFALVVIAVVFFTFRGGDSVDSVAANGKVFPDFVYRTSKSEKAYTIATEIPEILEMMPCYCSCVKVGHKSLKDCFIYSGGGYSQHGANCDVCIFEALDVNKWHDQGLSLKEIRNKIDKNYGGSRFGEGTDTPPVV